MEVWILVNNRAGRQHARENGEQVRRVFALGGARARGRRGVRVTPVGFAHPTTGGGVLGGGGHPVAFG